MFTGLPVGSIVANMGLLGYNPSRYYPNGRASFEAIAKKIKLNINDICFRCNIVSTDKNILTDFTSNNISDEKAKLIIESMKDKFPEVEFYSGQSYRNLIIIRNANIDASEINCFEPHNNIGKKLKNIEPYSSNPKAKKIIDLLKKIQLESIDVINNLNLSNCSARSLFPWSPSSKPNLPSFNKKFNKDGAIVSGLDFLHGFAKTMKLEHEKIQGANGYSNTNLKGKLISSIKNIENNDFIFIHINAPDEESHIHNLMGKVNILEKIDKSLLLPLIKFLDENYASNYRFAVMPDHYTYVESGLHDDKPVPYIIFGKDIIKDDIKYFSESLIEKKSNSLINGYEFLNFFFSEDVV